MRPEANAFAMRQGLVMGCMFAANFVVSTMPSIAFISWLIQGTILWYAYHSGVKCRQEIMEGEMSYGAGLWYVIQLFLYSSMVAGVFKYLYLKWIDTSYLTELMTAMKELVSTGKMPVTQEEADLMMEVLTPENMAIYSVAADTMIGFALGLVLAMFLKRSNI